MTKISILIILSFVLSGFLTAYGQSYYTDSKTANVTNDSTSPNLLENIVSGYTSGVKFRDVLPVAIGILLFSYFIWKTSSILSKRDVFSRRLTYTASGTPTSFKKRTVFYVVKYVVVFPLIMYGWVVVSFFFMWTLNNSLNFDVLTLIMIGIISATRIAAHWNEKLAEDIMKFLPFNLLFTFLLYPNLDLDKIIKAVHSFPPIMLELTVFIGFIGILEGLLKVVYFTVRRYHHT